MSRTRTKHPTPTPAAQWLMAATAELHSVDTETDAELFADIQERGIVDPLYVARDSRGYRVIDGARRLAAARAAGIETVPVTLGPVLRTETLSAHPGNVRRDLALSREFLASVRQFGIRVPLKIDEAGTVIDGHRRLAAALKLGVTHVPVNHDAVGALDQLADMVTTARHRAGLTLAEESDALFQMKELGASPAQMAAAAGVSQKTVKGMIQVAGSQAVAVEGLDLEQAARLAAVEQADPDLFADVSSSLASDPGYAEYTIRRAENTLEARAQQAKHLAKLEAAGARILASGELTKKASPVCDLSDLTRTADHAGCQGDAWVLENSDDLSYTRYCTNTTVFGHTARGSVDPEERQRVTTGNAEWDAATGARQQWITSLISRKHTAAERDAFLKVAVLAQLTGDGVLAKKRGVDRRPMLLGALLGLTPDATEDKGNTPRAVLSGRYMQAITATLAKASAARRPAYLFADYAACYELEIPRTVWRKDYRPAHAEEIYTFRAHRRQAAAYLTNLQELGYQPTPIEAAVIEDEAYTPATASA
ncbi:MULTISPECIES: ParB N-terminal domain-containing protein [unclassified Streptomyces]|uniref:ParB N-terminal domain-containing protein n=1 Tax=unclassified Streptomyces TaxID=2593676 RepID=UPI0033D7A352